MLTLKRNCLFLICFAISTLPIHAGASEKITASQWLIAGPLTTHLPAFSASPGISGKDFGAVQLLVLEQSDIRRMDPAENKKLGWINGQQHHWQKVLTDETGAVIIPRKEPGMPEITYLATYIDAGRFLSANLEISSQHIFEAWLNGEKIGAKTTTETDRQNGKMLQKIKLNRGNHLLVVKTLSMPGDDKEWKISATLSTEAPFQREDATFHLSPSNIKNIRHILDGLKIVSVNPSADGSMYAITYSRSLPPTDQSETWTEIKNTANNQLAHSFRHARLQNLSWLPRSNAISYTHTSNNRTSLFTHNLETGVKREILVDVEKMGNYKWATDESFLVYSVREDGTGADAIMRQILGMQDRQPQFRSRSFLYKVDVSTGAITRLTHGHLTTSLHDISPDGKHIIFSQSRPDYLERPYSKTSLMRMNLNDYSVDTLFADMRWGISVSYSPDGKYLLATGGPSAFGSLGENIQPGSIANNYDTQAYLIELKTLQVKSITLNFDPSVTSVRWHAQSGDVFILAVDEDRQQIYRYNPVRDQFTLVETGMEFASSMELSSGSPIMTFLANQVNQPRKAYIMNLRNRQTRILEDTESENYRHVVFGRVNTWDYTTENGVKVKGRYYLPPNFDPEKTYPVIVYYYGGTTPVGRTFGGRYPFNLWAGNGYVVYVLQPSGAIGFGQEFSAAHVNNWGITVADEIIESTRAFLANHSFADAKKVGCAGASYGGFMTMLLTTRTDLFAAAISHAGISSISSYWGEGYWGYAYSAEATAEQFPWNNQDIYVNQSPLFHADKVTTPLLLITGDSDTNVPPGESIQMYTALRMLDRPAELILVKGEDHHIVTYGKRIQWHNTIMAWWDRYLKDQPEYWFDLYPPNNY